MCHKSLSPLRYHADELLTVKEVAVSEMSHELSGSSTLYIYIIYCENKCARVCAYIYILCMCVKPLESQRFR